MKLSNSFKTSLGVLSIIALAQACGSGAEMNGDTAALIAKRDSLRNLKNDVSIMISELEDQIKILDTSGNHRVPLVSYQTLDVKSFKHYFGVQGFVETDRSADITPEVSGKILSIAVEEGAKVSKGQVLVRLDSRVMENSVAEVRTQMQLAETVFNKQKNLWEQKIGSEIQYLEAKNNFESLKKRYESMSAQLDMYNIKAPFDGTVDEIFPKAGEIVSPLTPVLRILNLSQVYIKADVSERYLDKIKVGDTAIINFPSVGIKKYSTISRMGKYINPNNRTFKVRFELKNDDARMMPNLLAEIEVQDYSNDSAIVVPVKLIQETPSGEEFVYLLHENGSPRAEKRMIKSGFSYKGDVEITTGLKDDEKIIVKGGRSIKDGELVEVISN